VLAGAVGDFSRQRNPSTGVCMMPRTQLWVDVEALKDVLDHSPINLEQDKAILAAAGVPPWFSSESPDQPEQIPSESEAPLKG